jgi:putative tRNA adenosine deaminase-associated protein
MTEFDADEYVSFDLDGAPDNDPAKQASARRRLADEANVSDVSDDGPDDDLDDDDDDDDLDDATADEIDFVLAAYREDGVSQVQALDDDLANDLEELVAQLRRLPGDAGAIGFVSLVEEVFVIVRVRGQHVQVLLSDATAAGDWPIARDVADYLGVEIPDPDDDDEPMGDLAILADLGLSEFELIGIIDNLDLGSDQMLTEISDKINIGQQFRRFAEAAFQS